jgi:putative FmdB family regulatory protein
VPRYQYRCMECNHDCVIHHLSTETVSICPSCNKKGVLIKQLTSFTSTNSKVIPKVKTGQVTEEFIQDARKELKQQRKDLLKKE